MGDTCCDWEFLTLCTLYVRSCLGLRVALLLSRFSHTNATQIKPRREEGVLDVNSNYSCPQCWSSLGYACVSCPTHPLPTPDTQLTSFLAPQRHCILLTSTSFFVLATSANSLYSNVSFLLSCSSQSNGKTLSRNIHVYRGENGYNEHLYRVCRQLLVKRLAVFSSCPSYWY